MKRWTVPVLLVVLFVCGAVFVAAAQEAPRPVTDDQVNAIAMKLYCPVCENITLDTCGTEACADWRDEIRTQLEQGRSEDAIIADFVHRFGDRVVGTPQDAGLRALSLVTPWVVIAAGVLILAWMVVRRRRLRNAPLSAAPNPAPAAARKYHDVIEQDLKG